MMRTIRNAEQRTALVERLNALDPQAQAAWGRMNVEQMMSHLAQTAEWPFGHVLPDQSNVFSRTVIKLLVLYLLPVPKEVKTSSQVDQLQDGRPPQGLEADRHLVIAALDRLANLGERDDCCSHPFFGKLTAKQWALLAHKHIDHHLRQFGA